MKPATVEPIEEPPRWLPDSADGAYERDLGAAGHVVAVSRSGGHGFGKPNQDGIDLIAGHGVDGDAHAGSTVQHRSRIAVDLLGLSRGSRLHLGTQAVIEVTGLRNPCHQLDDFRPGLMRAVLDRDEDGGLIRKAGVMGVVVTGGTVRPADGVRVELPGPPHEKLVPV